MPKGLRLIDRFAARYLEEERAAIASLDVREQEDLAQLLQQVLLGLGRPANWAGSASIAASEGRLGAGYAIRRA